MRNALPLLMASALLFMLASCQLFQRHSDEQVLARVYDRSLYASQLEGLVPRGASKDDSTRIVKAYIDRWVREQVFLHRVSQDLPEKPLNIERLIEDYRNSLLIHAFEKQLVQMRMDTVVTDRELREFYEANREAFILRENIAQVLYVKVPRDAPDQWQVRRLYRSTEESDRQLLEEYCLQHAASYYIDPDNWLLFADVMRDVPLQATSPESWLRNNRYAEITDEFYRYFLSIVDYKLVGSQSPFVFEKENIRDMILSRRRSQFIQRQRESFYQEALRGNHIYVFGQ